MKSKVHSDSTKKSTRARIELTNNPRTISTFHFRVTKPITAFVVIIFLTAASVMPAFTQTRSRPSIIRGAPSGDTPGISWTGDMGVQRRTAEVMDAQVTANIFAKPE